MIQGDPYQLRFAASRMSSGAQEIRNKANRLQATAEGMLHGQQGWSGEAADVFQQASEGLHHDFVQVSDALVRVGQVFQMLSSKMEHVNQMRQEASQVEQAIWGMSEETPEDRRYISQLRHRAQELRYAAEMEARAADEQAANDFREIEDVERSLRFGKGTGGTGSTSSTMQLTRAQEHRMHKEQEMLDEREASQKPMTMEDLLALYYILKGDTMSYASTEDIIEQNLQMDGIKSEEDLRNAIAIQIQIHQENSDLESFCSRPENQDDPRCLVYRYNQAGGLDPAALIGTGAAAARAMTPAVKKGLTALKDKLFPKGDSLKVALPGGGSLDLPSESIYKSTTHPDHIQKGEYKLKPKTTYEANGYTYETDDLGRIKSVQGTLKLEKADRNKTHQIKAGGEDRLQTDVGGHLIASIFGGSGKIDNLVAMNTRLNNSKYKAMENTWKTFLLDGKTISVNVKPIYDGNSMRPTKFNILYKVNGKSYKHEFLNQ